MAPLLEQFNFQLTGEQNLPKILFVHGLMGSGVNWRKITSLLGSRYCCGVFDQRGHGRNAGSYQGFRPDDYAQDILQISEAVGWEKFHLVGHSMGGRNSLKFAHLYPTKLSSLTIVDISPGPSPRGYEFFASLLKAIPTPFPTKKAAKDFFFNEFPHIPLRMENPAVLGQFLYTNLLETGSGAADWRFAKDGVLQSAEIGGKTDFWPIVDQLLIPTLWIRGEHSRDLSEDTLAEIQRRNPRVSALTIPNAGHWVHSDQPRVFVEKLSDFVDKNSRRAF